MQKPTKTVWLTSEFKFSFPRSSMHSHIKTNEKKNGGKKKEIILILYERNLKCKTIREIREYFYFNSQLSSLLQNFRLHSEQKKNYLFFLIPYRFCFSCEKYFCVYYTKNSGKIEENKRFYDKRRKFILIFFYFLFPFCNSIQISFVLFCFYFSAATNGSSFFLSNCWRKYPFYPSSEPHIAFLKIITIVFYGSFSCIRFVGFFLGLIFEFFLLF